MRLSLALRRRALSRDSRDCSIEVQRRLLLRRLPLRPFRRPLRVSTRAAAMRIRSTCTGHPACAPRTPWPSTEEAPPGCAKTRCRLPTMARRRRRPAGRSPLPSRATADAADTYSSVASTCSKPTTAPCDEGTCRRGCTSGLERVQLALKGGVASNTSSTRPLEVVVHLRVQCQCGDEALERQSLRHASMDHVKGGIKKWGVSLNPP